MSFKILAIPDNAHNLSIIAVADNVQNKYNYHHYKTFSFKEDACISETIVRCEDFNEKLQMFKLLQEKAKLGNTNKQINTSLKADDEENKLWYNLSQAVEPNFK